MRNPMSIIAKHCQQNNIKYNPNNTSVWKYLFTLPTINDRTMVLHLLTSLLIVVKTHVFNEDKSKEYYQNAKSIADAADVVRVQLKLFVKSASYCNAVIATIESEDRTYSFNQRLSKHEVELLMLGYSAGIINIKPLQAKYTPSVIDDMYADRYVINGETIDTPWYSTILLRAYVRHYLSNVRIMQGWTLEENPWIDRVNMNVNDEIILHYNNPAFAAACTDAWNKLFASKDVPAELKAKWVTQATDACKDIFDKACNRVHVTVEEEEYTTITRVFTAAIDNDVEVSTKYLNYIVNRNLQK